MTWSVQIGSWRKACQTRETLDEITTKPLVEWYGRLSLWLLLDREVWRGRKPDPQLRDLSLGAHSG